MATEVEIKVVPSRVQPNPVADNFREGVPVRGTKYSEVSTQPMVRKSHMLADEGAYFVTHNNQTAIASPLITAFTAVSPMALIQNLDSAGGKRLYLDYMALVTGTAGAWASAGVNAQLMLVLDNINRYSSAGTALTANIVSPNMDVSTKSIAGVYFGQIVAPAASAVARTLVGLRIVRPAVNATTTDVTGELKYFNFGGVEGSMNGSFTLANANIIPMPFPPVIIGPGQSCLIYYVMNGTTPSAQTFFPEFGWWER